MALVEHRNYLQDVLARQARRRQAVGAQYEPQPKLSTWLPSAGRADSAAEASTSDVKGKSKANVTNYVPAEEAVRNDYEARYGVSGEFPSNYVLGAGGAEICEEFPALRRLMDLKAASVTAASHAPLRCSLPDASPSSILSSLAPQHFDVILLHPPASASWAEIAALPIRQLSADPGFVFLWVGTGDSDGLERGRECLARWGFRRAEDIVWVKTNRRSTGGAGGAGRGTAPATAAATAARNAGANGNGLFASQKEHCLMGIRGTVRRSTDAYFVHCNVDTDVIVWEREDGDGADVRTPPYLYTLIENFCLGARRLELFGSAPRRGWVSAQLDADAAPDAEAEAEAFDSATYPSLLPSKDEGKPVVPFSAEIDALRPKSPQRRAPGQRRQQQQPRYANVHNQHSQHNQHNHHQHQHHGQHGHGHGHGQHGPPRGVMRMGALTDNGGMMKALLQQQMLGMGPQMAQMQMGQLGQMGQLAHMGQMGQMGQMAGMGGMGGMQLGMMGHNPMGQPGQSGQPGQPGQSGQPGQPGIAGGGGGMGQMGGMQMNPMANFNPMMGMGMAVPGMPGMPMGMAGMGMLPGSPHLAPPVMNPMMMDASGGFNPLQMQQIAMQQAMAGMGLGGTDMDMGGQDMYGHMNMGMGGMSMGMGYGGQSPGPSHHGGQQQPGQPGQPGQGGQGYYYG